MMITKQISVFSLLTTKMLQELQKLPKTEKLAREHRQLSIPKLDRTWGNWVQNMKPRKEKISKWKNYFTWDRCLKAKKLKIAENYKVALDRKSMKKAKNISFMFQFFFVLSCSKDIIWSPIKSKSLKAFYSNCIRC